MSIIAGATIEHDNSKSKLTAHKVRIGIVTTQNVPERKINVTGRFSKNIIIQKVKTKQRGDILKVKTQVTHMYE